ncbi:MAG TPA: ABC transporter ATP-binding protein [Acidimicrobiales bacterium]|nr:ABC transporter ATP-binding protein [Acidimicrobiales bacterium]
MEPILEADDVHVEYGPVHALDGASLAVQPGEWVAVAGPSGSGKSTLLQLFAALDHPTSGQIRFRGQDLGARRVLDDYRRRDIGLVFQLHNLLPHLDAQRNVEVAMFGTHRHRGARRREAAELLAQVQLQEQAGRFPPELSGGERQRVAIARALANRPSVLLADEPTGNLDPDSVANVVDVFRRLHREGLTIVMVTHDRQVAEAADRVVTLERGRILEAGGGAGAGPGGEAGDGDDDGAGDGVGDGTEARHQATPAGLRSRPVGTFGPFGGPRRSEH